MRFLGLLLSFLTVHGASGLSTCLDPEDETYRCQAGNTQIVLSSCDIADEDHEALGECFDNVGRGTIERVELNSNRLSTLPSGMFDGLGSLKRLHLAFNGLSELPPGLLDGKGNLLYLYLESNSLSTLPAGLFDDLASVRMILLNNNALSTLPAGLFSSLPSLRYLDLDANPELRCVPAATGSAELTFLTHELTSVGAGGPCACPAEGACEGCRPGMDGFTCPAAAAAPSTEKQQQQEHVEAAQQ